jgi:hypothetical protein
MDGAVGDMGELGRAAPPSSVTRAANFALGRCVPALKARVAGRMTAKQRPQGARRPPQAKRTALIAALALAVVGSRRQRRWTGRESEAPCPTVGRGKARANAKKARHGAARQEVRSSAADVPSARRRSAPHRRPDGPAAHRRPTDGTGDTRRPERLRRRCEWVRLARRPREGPNPSPTRSAPTTARCLPEAALRNARLRHRNGVAHCLYSNSIEDVRTSSAGGAPRVERRGRPRRRRPLRAL